MKLSAKEAKDLMPRGYISTDEIFKKIKAAAESGIDYFWTDLTQGQCKEFKDLGYSVEYSQYSGDRPFKISWDKA